MNYLVVTGTKKEFNATVENYLIQKDMQNQQRGLGRLEYYRTEHRLSVGVDTFIYVNDVQALKWFKSILKPNKIVFWGTTESRKDIVELKAIAGMK